MRTFRQLVIVGMLLLKFGIGFFVGQLELV